MKIILKIVLMATVLSFFNFSGNLVEQRMKCQAFCFQEKEYIFSPVNNENMAETIVK